MKRSCYAVALATVGVSAFACDVGQRIESSQLDDFGRFGRSVDMNGVRAVVGAYQESNGTAEGAAYVYTRGGDTWSLRSRLVSPSPGDEQFGDDVAIHLTTLAVGAPLDNQPGAFRSGSVYLFEQSGNDWVHFQTLESPFPQQAWEAFGVSVAMDDDVIVVGAVDRDQLRATDAGAAFVFERNAGGTFSLVASLAAPNPSASEKFGSEVEVVGDTVVVSAVRRDMGDIVDAGAVYVFEREVETWDLVQTLNASDASEDALFGTGLALFEQSTGDRRLVVGAEGDANGTGATYVFDAPAAAGFTETTKLSASDGTAGDIFGTAVAISDATIVVGASSHDTGAANAGAVYAYRLTSGSWVEEAKLTASSPAANDNFGSAVGVDLSYALFGAPNKETGVGFTSPGTALAFRRETNGTWVDSHALSAAGDDTATRYAKTLAVDGPWLVVPGPDHADIHRLDADAYSLAQVIPSQPGSNYESASVDGDTAAFLGRRTSLNPTNVVYVEVWTEAGGVWSSQQVIEPDFDGTQAEEAGNSAVVALEGDTLIVGSQRFNGGDGRVYVYERSNGSWSDTQVFTSPDAATNFDRNFGREVAIDGDWLAIAELPSASVPNGSTSGSVYMYERVNGTFTLQQTITAPSPGNTDFFGQAIALDGDLLAIQQGSGSVVRVYRRSAGVYSEMWSVADPAFDSSQHLALSNDRLVIGVPEADFGSFTDAGELRVYERQPNDTFQMSGGAFRAGDAETDLQLGGAVALDGSRVFGGTDFIDSTRRRVYVFDL